MNHARLYIDWGGNSHEVDLDNGLDVSLSIKDSKKAKGASAWYVDGPRFEEVRGEGFVGRVSEGGSVNFTDVYFNPHGHGTHTECLGHITREFESVDEVLRSKPLDPIMPCMVLSVEPVEVSGDSVITLDMAPEGDNLPPAVLIRTLPNTKDKKTQTWDNTNPPYLHPSFTKSLVDRGVMHLLIDLPSVDREVDGGELLSHKVFFGVPDNPRFSATITEFVFVPDSSPDGLYALNLQVANLDLDASPSRPVLFPLR